ncbi:zinc ribbon domain-containing protein YjdM [Amphritea japonica]|uniref:Phosphonoacetate hydrolase n=1 Tax=Amphritea japonica ATCC BAA-1530 TaxID=1278309 RepID=A0A7R6PC80_9GAMM|nr:zinc ribbon domain-containing protein YjdM [Amphritea japonica]BBB27352.1 phosphonoacetate hydrolase [Amphritea japonica ATCC BAA-1530]
MSYPLCPKCNSEFVYEDQTNLVCPECAHEWNPSEAAQEEEIFTVKDANGTLLEAGDKVTLIKDLKVKGSSQVLKVGTKASIRRIVEGKDHELDCKLAGAGEMMVTAKFVKKA